MLGEKIRMFRLERGLEIGALSEMVGVSAIAIDYYEENKWRPGTETIVRLAHALGVELTEFIEGCTILNKDNGEMLLVCNNTGNKVKVLGRITKELQHMCYGEMPV